MNILPIEVKNIRLTLLGGKNPKADHRHLYDVTFKFWMNFWTQVYAEVGSQTTPNPDDFFRQDYIPVLHIGDEILATHMYSIFDVSQTAIQHHSYFKKMYPENVFSELEAKNISKVMTMEYLCVNPKYRKTKLPFSMSHVLISLGIKTFLEITDCDSILTVLRVDNKTLDLSYQFGFEELKNLDRSILYNAESAYSICIKNQARVTEEAQSLKIFTDLWEQNQYQMNSSRKKAA